MEDVTDFINREFVKYDAICVLDDVEDEIYSLVVKKTMERNIDLFVVPKMIDVGKTNAKIVRFDDVLTLYMPEKHCQILRGS